MDRYAEKVKKKVFGLLEETGRYGWVLSKDGTRDFSRRRKLPFDRVIKTLLGMGGRSLKNELLDAFHFSTQTPSVPAFIQQRAKLSEHAMPFIFSQIVEMFPCSRLPEGYRLLACDGSDLHYAANPAETENYFQTDPHSKGYNLLHLNAMYDLCSRRYVDAIVQPRRQADEIGAFITMVDRFPADEKTIFTADRGYESYNLLAHVQERGMKYLIRVKDPSSCGILKSLHLPVGQAFDRHFHLLLTRKQTGQVKANPDLYRILPKKARFDFCDLHHTLFYPLSFRVTSVQIAPGKFEYLLSNLDPDVFPPLRLKQLYRMRWDIETSFRHLKHTIGLTHFHSKKAEFISQEIFARLIMYNLCELIAAHAAMFHRTKSHVYQLNFSVAVHIVKQAFFSPVASPLPDVISLIRRHLLPLRPDRHNPRKVKSRSAVCFNYRLS